MADEPERRPLPVRSMVFHAVLAAVVFFLLNHFALAQSLDTSLMWGVLAAPFAAYLAYSQSRR